MLYAAAGARLWIAPERIGAVTRVGEGCPFDPRAYLERAGIGHVTVATTGREQLVEWFLYEEDGSRRSLPRNRALRNAGGEGAGAGSAYLAHLEAQSPSAADIPQSGCRRARSTSPRRCSRAMRRAFAPSLPAPASLPSTRRPITAPVAPWRRSRASSPRRPPSSRANGRWRTSSVRTGGRDLASALPRPASRRSSSSAGRRGRSSASGGAGQSRCPRNLPRCSIRPGRGTPSAAPTPPAGSRALPPAEAARWATVAASLVIECEGADAALALAPDTARRRLEGENRPPGDVHR